MNPAEISDQQLFLAYVREKSDDAFRAIVDRHARWVFAAGFRQLGDRQLAEDATQTVFILLAQRCSNMSANQKLSGWLFNTLGYTVKNLRRQLRRRQIHEQQASIEREISTVAPLRVDDLSIHLDSAVAGLGKVDREVILLRFYQERSFEEIADVLGITAIAARKRVSRCTEKLRKYFDEIGVGKERDAAAFSAAALQGFNQAPPALAQSVAHVALAAKAGAAIPATILTTMKGTALLMTAAKIKLLATIVLICIVAIPATVVAIHYAPTFFADSPATNSTIEAVNPEDSWRIENINSEMVDQLAPEVRILPTKFSAAGNSVLVPAMSGSDKVVGIRASVLDMAWAAYHVSPARIVFATAPPLEKYDFLLTVSQNSAPALQRELKNQLGWMASHQEKREMEVLLLKVENPSAPGLVPPSGVGNNIISIDGNNNARIKGDDRPFSHVADVLEKFVKMPVIDQTGVKEHFSIDLKWKELGEQDPNHDALKQALRDQLGLELVPSRMTIEVLVIEKTMD